MKNTKVVGTFVPLTALRTNTAPRETGTFAAGLAFLDWLKKTGQNAWQMLPLHETHLVPGSTTIHASSPYKGYGVGIDPRFLSRSTVVHDPSSAGLRAFSRLHEDWIDDYTFFCALRDQFGTDDWTRWPEELRTREPSALETWRGKCAASTHHHLTLQWKLHQQYRELREKAHLHGIALVGDLPFYLPLRSPLVWTHQRLFDIDESGRLHRVSGIPDSLRAHFGRQAWGHPVYRWDESTVVDDILGLWKLRLRYFSTLFDMVRIDHAKGFFTYGQIDPLDPLGDEWKIGPGARGLTALVAYARKISLQVFAEDSGEGAFALRQTLERLAVPGIRNFRFALLTKGEERVIPHYADVTRYPTHCVAYTSTHDTETLRGYLSLLTPDQKRKLAEHAGVSFEMDDRTLTVSIRNAIIASPARMVLVPIQDWFLTTDRINVPGTEKDIGDPNWRYVLQTAVEDLPVDGLMS